MSVMDEMRRNARKPKLKVKSKVKLKRRKAEAPPAVKRKAPPGGGCLKALERAVDDLRTVLEHFDRLSEQGEAPPRANDYAFSALNKAEALLDLVRDGHPIPDGRTPPMGRD